MPNTAQFMTPEVLYRNNNDGNAADELTEQNKLWKMRKMVWGDMMTSQDVQ